MAVVFGERATKHVGFGTRRGLNLPGGGQSVLSCLDRWCLWEEKMIE